MKTRNGLHICVNTYKDPLPLRPPTSVRAEPNFLAVPVICTVVPISVFNDLCSQFFFTNPINVFIDAAPNFLMKPVSKENRTFTLKMYIFEYKSGEFGVLKELIKYILEIVRKLTYGMPFG